MADAAMSSGRDGRFVPWSIGMFAAIIMALGSYTLTTQASSRDRLAKVEARVDALGPLNKMLDKRLERMEKKLDRLIERRNR